MEQNPHEGLSGLQPGQGGIVLRTQDRENGRADCQLTIFGSLPFAPVKGAQQKGVRIRNQLCRAKCIARDPIMTMCPIRMQPGAQFAAKPFVGPLLPVAFGNQICHRLPGVFVAHDMEPDTFSLRARLELREQGRGRLLGLESVAVCAPFRNGTKQRLLFWGGGRGSYART